MTVLAFTPAESISFKWNAPPDMPVVRKTGTWVVVRLERGPKDKGTRVVLINDGYKKGPEWDRALAYFDKAWELVMRRLERRFSTGPIDWSKEP